jgi:hypothetical protein
MLRLKFVLPAVLAFVALPRLALAGPSPFDCTPLESNTTLCLPTATATVDQTTYVSDTNYVTQYSTEVEGLLQGSSTPVFDQTLAASTSSSAFASAVALAETVLTGDGATSFVPTSASSSNTTPSTSTTNTTTGTTTEYGELHIVPASGSPVSITYGDLGTCTGDAPAAYGNFTGWTFSGCSGGTPTTISGTYPFTYWEPETLTIDAITSTTTTTDTTTISTLYEIEGLLPATTVPEPATGALLLAGIGAAWWRSRRRRAT